MADYPTNYPSFTDLNGQATLAANNHAARHNKVHAEVTAIAQRVGKTGDTDPTTHEKKIADLQSGLSTTNSNLATTNSNLATTTTNTNTNTTAISTLGAVAVRTTDTSVSGYSFVLNENDLASNSSTKVPTQSSVKTYIDDNKEYYSLVASSVNTAVPGGYTPVALSTPCTLTIPVVSGRKYLVTASNSYMSNSAAAGEIDYGPAVGTTPINSGTYGASTGTYGLPITSRAIYTASSTGNVTFQIVVGCSNAITVRTDSPMLTAKRVY